MNEFIREWWFIVVGVPAFVGYAVYISISKKYISSSKYESIESSKPGWVLGGVILLGLILPQIYRDEIVNELKNKQFDIIYALYLSSVLIGSYYFRKSSYFFVLLSNFIIANSWPRTEKMPLYMGVFIALICVIYLVSGGS